MLETIRRGHVVDIPLAIESGSRAWGFPSPDSDHDCRFVFIRSRAESFTLFPRRDVIELPITPVFDVSGWELGKALKLLLDGNAVIIEWLTSPVTYSADAAFRTEFLSLAQRLADRRLVGKHYYHLARRQAERFLDSETVALKKIFYALRPLMALRWLDRHPDRTVAPMHFPTLCAEADLDDVLSGEIDDLRVRKAQSRELGEGATPGRIASFIRAELDGARRWAETRPPQDRRDAHREVDVFWRKWIEISASRHAAV